MPKDKKSEQTIEQPLIEHLLELRKRLIVVFAALFACVGFCYIFSEDIFNFLVQPLADLAHENAAMAEMNRRLIFTGMAEQFFTQLKVSFFAGGMLAFPVIAWQLWKFIAPALYETERSAFVPFLVATPVLFLLGAALAYYGVIPLAWRFFMSFEQTGNAMGEMPIVLEPRVAEYLSLTMALIFAFGVAFQLPIVLTLLGRAGLIDAKSLHRKRRYMLLGAFVVSAVLTPPDIISQTALAIPLYGLYEISILLVRWGELRRENRKVTLSNLTMKDFHNFQKTCLTFLKNLYKWGRVGIALVGQCGKFAHPFVKRWRENVVWNGCFLAGLFRKLIGKIRK